MVSHTTEVRLDIGHFVLAFKGAEMPPWLQIPRAPVTPTMDVTKGNFSARLPEIEAAIDSAIFLAIDGEFTGLNADKGNSAFDLPAERYSKVKQWLQCSLVA